MTPFFVPPAVISTIEDSWNGLGEFEVYLPVRPYPTRAPATYTPDLRRIETEVDRHAKSDWRISPPGNRSMDLVEYEREYAPVRVGTVFWIPETVAVCSVIAAGYTHVALFDGGRWIVRLPPGPRGPGTKSAQNVPHGEHRFEVTITDFEIKRLSTATFETAAGPLPWLGLWKMTPDTDPWVWAFKAHTTRAAGGVVP